jgi:hypothetical protein
LTNRLLHRLTSNQNLTGVGVDVYIYHVFWVYHHSRPKSTAQLRFSFLDWCMFRIAPFFQIKNKNVKSLNYWKINVDSSLCMSKWYVKIIQGIWWRKKVSLIRVQVQISSWITNIFSFIHRSWLYDIQK